MTKEEIQAISEILDSKLQGVEERLAHIMDKKLEPIQQDLKEIKFQMNTVYGWVDKIDLDVKDLKKAQ